MRDVNDETIQHFSVWKAFNDKVYHKTLTYDNVVSSSEKYIDKVFEVTPTDGGRYSVVEGKIIETKCVFLEKNGKKYILPSKYEKEMPLNPYETFECYLKEADKTIYTFIVQPRSVKINPDKTLSLKDLVAVFNPLTHTDDKTWTFLKLQAIGAKAKGCKFRLCSPPSTGKNSNSTIIHCITNDTVKISKPTLPKMETLLYFNQQVVLDELTSLTASHVRELEPFFLTMGDESPTFTKHSLAKNRDLNEVDVTRSSIVFTYNDPVSLGEGSKFFDDLWQSKEAFQNRYPALFLEGKIVSSLPKLSYKESVSIMENNFDRLAMISKNLVYYFKHLSDELHGYDRSKLRMSGRHKANFEGVIDALDVFSDSQEEFDRWLSWVNDSMIKYGKLQSKGIELFSVVEEEEVK